MPLEDLDLEFEDEEDLKKRQNSNGQVQQDVDLEFGAAETPAPVAAAPAAPKVGTAPPVKSAAPPATPAARAQTPAGNGQVKSLDEARQAAARPATPPPRPMTSGANAMALAPQSEEVGFAQLSAELESTKFEARVQVAVAEFKTDIMSDLLSDVKMLDYQVHQLLVRINQKHPELKPEVMALKKLLADFAAKKRK